jgi:hypothetical protein
MAIVFIPAQLQDLTDGLDQVELDASSLREVIARLEERFPGTKDRLCDDDELSPALQVSVNHVMTRPDANDTRSARVMMRDPKHPQHAPESEFEPGYAETLLQPGVVDHQPEDFGRHADVQAF